MAPRLKWIPFCLIALAGWPLLSEAAEKGKQSQAQKNDEKRENEAVRKAQKDVKAAQEAESDAERSAKRAHQELKAAELSLAQATAAMQKIRGDLEEKHSKAAGLLVARRNAEEARKAYVAAGQPLLQRLAETAQYRQAVEAARDAEQRLARLQNESSGNTDERRQQMADAARVKLIPGQLERAALDADPALKPDRATLMAAEEAVAAARKVTDRAIDNDPALKAAAEKLDAARRDVATARRDATQQDRQLMDARQKLAREQQDLQQKIAADKRDDNKPNRKK